jgi:hypothetical protein
MPLAFLFPGGFPWRLGVVAIIVALVAAVKLQHDHIARMSLTLEATQHAAEDQKLLAEHLRHAAERVSKVTSETALKAEAARKKFSALRQEIYNGSHDDGPVAPVLRRTLDRLPSARAAEDTGSQ